MFRTASRKQFEGKEPWALYVLPAQSLTYSASISEAGLTVPGGEAY
jgi:hypothetical protein